ncbi:MAG: putative ABC transport system permease protein [Arenicella sp.]|jgi:putative ABC transport system permease protein
MNLFSFAYKNLWRNKRRSIVTLLAIICGFTSISVFGGYISDTFKSLKVQAVSGERLGHLTIFKQGMLTEGKLRPENYLFSPDDMALLKEVVRDTQGVRLVTPGLPISGIFNSDDASTIFIGDGVVPEDVEILRGDIEEGYGGRVYSDNEIGIAIASDMGRLLEMDKGSLPILLVSTFEGQANAMDAEVVDIFNTGNAGTNDKMILVPFDYAQKLMDTDGAQRFVVLLDDIKQTESMRVSLAEALGERGLAVEIKTWNELSSFYNQVSGLFNMIFTFMFSIVFTVIVMSIINTMSMAIVERTREIGTLRALGLKKKGIVTLFTLEGAFLGMFGVAIGTVLSVLIAFVIKVANITYVPPNSSGAVPLLIDLNFSQMSFIFLCTIVLAALAAAWPAFGATRRDIRSALTYN